MTKSRFSVYAVSSLVLALALTTGVSAANDKATTTKGNATSSGAVTKERTGSTSTSTGNATSSAAKNKNNATSTASTTNGEAHRSAVATFVQNLLDVANRQPGIGDQVREIARAQNDEGSSTAEAIEAASSRSQIKTLLLGSDYKNLGVIRNALASNEKRIEKLSTLRDDTFNLTDRETLTNQIDLLKAEDTKLEAFLKANESKFSIFGWFTKIFQK